MKWKIYCLTIALWALGCFVYSWLSIKQYLANPCDSDLYAHTIGFQVAVFFLFRMPILAIVLAAILSVEKALMSRIIQGRRIGPGNKS